MKKTNFPVEEQKTKNTKKKTWFHKYTLGLLFVCTAAIIVGVETDFDDPSIISPVTHEVPVEVKNNSLDVEPNGELTDDQIVRVCKGIAVAESSNGKNSAFNNWHGIFNHGYFVHFDTVEDSFRYCERTWRKDYGYLPDAELAKKWVCGSFSQNQECINNAKEIWLEHVLRTYYQTI